MHKVVKRNGAFQKFDKKKVIEAIDKASERAGSEVPQKTKDKIVKQIESYVACSSPEFNVSTREISIIVEDKLMASAYKDVARKYIEYRHDADLIHQMNTTDDDILGLVKGDNDEWNKENSNKNACLVTTQRDYIAGIVSKDVARRYIVPENVMKAHDEGAIHIHDLDYILENSRTNCCLVNLDDMLQNGTMLNGIMIEKPHRLLTAATIATQIILAVSSSQYGGLTVSLAHLAPFVDSSRQIYIKKYEDELGDVLPDDFEFEVDDEELKKELPAFAKRMGL